MEPVDSEELKQAYLKLSPSERREVAHWILARELSGRAGASLQPEQNTGAKTSRRFPLKPVLATAALLLLAGALAAGARHWMAQRKQLSHQEDASRQAAEEAKRPNSPSNLEFLARNVGNEITVRGVPQDSEVGYLYFNKSRKKALRLNFFAGGVVLLQSGDLADLVREKQELEIQGILEKTGDGFYEIRVQSQNRLKKLNP